MGVALIALCNFLLAAFLGFLAISLAVRGSMGAVFGAPSNNPLWHYGTGASGWASPLAFAIIAILAGYGVWTLRAWGRKLCIVLSAFIIVRSLPGLLVVFSRLPGAFSLGGFFLLRIAVNILILWYLARPQVRALFQQPPQIETLFQQDQGSRPPV